MHIWIPPECATYESIKHTQYYISNAHRSDRILSQDGFQWYTPPTHTRRERERERVKGNPDNKQTPHIVSTLESDTHTHTPPPQDRNTNMMSCATLRFISISWAVRIIWDVPRVVPIVITLSWWRLLTNRCRLLRNAGSSFAPCECARTGGGWVREAK